MSSAKPQVTTEYRESHDQHSEFETRDGTVRASGASRIVESVRLGLTVLALLAGLTMLGTAATTLQVYNTTTLTTDFRLSPWPKDLDLRPTIALVVCGTIIFLASTISLIAGKTQAVRNNHIAHSVGIFVAPAVCLISGLIGASFYYGVNTSTEVYSLQAWSCQWSSISMDMKPHWGRLCKESKTSLYLSVMIIPLEVCILIAAVFGARTERKSFVFRERKGSPAMS